MYLRRQRRQLDESRRLLERFEEQQQQAFDRSAGGGSPHSAAAAAAGGHLPGESGTIPLATPLTSLVSSSTTTHFTTSTTNQSSTLSPSFSATPHTSFTHTKSHTGTSYGTHLRPTDSIRTSHGASTTTTRHHLSGTSYRNRTPAAGDTGSNALRSTRSPGGSPVLSRRRGHITPTGSVTVTSYGVQAGPTSPAASPRGVAKVDVVARGPGGAVVNGYRERVEFGGGATGGGGRASPGKGKVDLSALYEQCKFCIETC